MREKAKPKRDPLTSDQISQLDNLLKQLEEERTALKASTSATASTSSFSILTTMASA